MRISALLFGLGFLKDRCVFIDLLVKQIMGSD